VSDKPSAAWYLAPIFLGIVGSAIMWYVLKDEDHPDSPKMVRKGWVIGIVLTMISVAWIPFMLIPLMIMGFDEERMPGHVEIGVPQPEQRMIPQPAPEEPDTPVISTERTAEIQETCYVLQEEWQLMGEIIGLSQIELEAMADVCDLVGVNIYGAGG